MSSRIQVDIFTDPGLPSDGISHVLKRIDPDEGQYAFSHRQQEIPLLPTGMLDLLEARQLAKDNDADYLIIVTEIPRHEAGRPMIADLQFDERLAIISVPTLGFLRPKQRLKESVFDSLDALSQDAVPGAPQLRAKFGRVFEQTNKSGRTAYLTYPKWRSGRLTTLLGMVRTNQPILAVPKLKGVLAAATATGAFGIFYSSIWAMANALPPWRLLLIALTAIAVMVVWLLFSNRLWERAWRRQGRIDAAMYNGATILSLVLTVSFLYLTLFTGILVAAFIIIDASYLGELIGQEASFLNYLDIAWLSASLGTVAGALGSNFDTENDIKRLTHGRRELQRQEEE